MTSRRWITGGALAFGLVLSAFSSAQEKLFSPQELRVDIAFMMQTFEDVHPNLYAFLDKPKATYRREALERRLTYQLTSSGFHDSLKPFVDAFGDGHTVLLSPGASLEALISQQSVDPDSYTFRIPKPSVGLIDFRAMENLERFQAFLKDSFGQIQARGLKTLVLDLRSNGGGNSALGSALLDYLTDQPYRLFSRYEAKVSTQMTRYRLNRGMGLPWPADAANGSIYRSEVPFEKPTQNSLRFKGKIYVLISECTASSAIALSAAFKDFKLAVMVGEETGNPATEYGEVYPFKLPNTGLEVWTSSVYWVRPGNFDDGRGVLPDVQIPSSQALEWVLERVK